MKNLLFLFTICMSLSLCSFAQLLGDRNAFEITTSPLGLLAPEAFILPISAEFLVNDHVGIGLETLNIINNSEALEADMTNEQSKRFEFILYGSAKYYFDPELGADRFYIGSYAGSINLNDNTGLGLGFMMGQKWVFAKDMLFDLSFGFGRQFTETQGFLPYAKCHIGYRFNNN